jgi:LacI family transcriptional regulator, fructose operon transcriptional repressor
MAFEVFARSGTNVVRIKDVAAKAGVSTATVSRVLAGKPNISQPIKDRVFAAVKNLDYRPNRIARSLRNRQASTIGLIVSDLTNPFFSLISRAVEEIAYKRGMAVLFFNTDENPDKEALCLDLLKDEFVQGIIFAPTSLTSNSPDRRIDIEIPMVAINRKIQSMEVDTVLIDNFDSSYRLVSHLFADGYRKIAGLFSDNNGTVLARCEGFRKAMQEKGLTILQGSEYFGDTTEEAGYEGAKTLLESREPPEAIVATNASLATGAFRFFRDHGVKLPHDLGFACFDESPWTTLVDPQITIIKQPTYEIGRAAIELLFKRIADQEMPIRDIVLRGELIVRESCRRPGSLAH